MFIVRVISQPCEPNGPSGLNLTCPDRGHPTQYGWWAPVALRYIKRVGGQGTHYEVNCVAKLPIDNPFRSRIAQRRREAPSPLSPRRLSLTVAPSPSTWPVSQVRCRPKAKVHIISLSLSLSLAPYPHAMLIHRTAITDGFTPR